MIYAIKCNNIVTFDENECLKLFDGFIIISGGQISDLTRTCPDSLPVLDATGKTVTPGLIDAHTHLIHAGSRENELKLKLEGVPYMEILKRGGGILSTVNKTRAAAITELKKKAKKSLDIMLSNGTTTVEAKSGYGLDLETEIKCLTAARELNTEQPVDIVSTYMGAHAVPPEYKDNRRGYIDYMIKEVMPRIKSENLAEFTDVFCEEGVFSVDESREILTAAKELGFAIKIHADEIEPTGGAELAAELCAVSAEHLLAASDTGADAMARAGVCAVILPGTSFYLRTGKFARAKEMIARGVRVALATDYNPGSCPTENLQTIMTFAAFGAGLSPSDILKGMTLNAARAVNRTDEIGNIKPGMKADLVIFDAPNIDYIVYHFGVNHVLTVIKNGKTVKGEGF